MTRNDEILSETDIRHPDSELSVIRANEGEFGRYWLDGAPICRPLEEHRIVHMGIGKMPAPFEIVRMELGGSYFLSCFGGAGEVLTDGRWEPCTRGQAFLLSPGTLHAFRARPEERWDFCWVRYREVAGQNPIASARSPVSADFSTEPFKHAVEGLYLACSSPDASPTTLSQWVEVVHGYVLEFAHPDQLDPRLARLWSVVESDLSADWSTRKMAGIANVCEKHLERLCKRDLGRTPRQHLIVLRMHYAAELLTTTDMTVEAIALAVGYQNPFTFSSRFRRFSGWPPSHYPGRR